MSVDGVKSWMQFWGWDDGGKPGSVKRDVHGHVVARHGSDQWNKDVEDAVRMDKRERTAGIQPRHY